MLLAHFSTYVTILQLFSVCLSFINLRLAASISSFILFAHICVITVLFFVDECRDIPLSVKFQSLVLKSMLLAVVLARFRQHLKFNLFMVGVSLVFTLAYVAAMPLRRVYGCPELASSSLYAALVSATVVYVFLGYVFCR